MPPIGYERYPEDPPIQEIAAKKSTAATMMELIASAAREKHRADAGRRRWQRSGEVNSPKAYYWVPGLGDNEYVAAWVGTAGTNEPPRLYTNVVEQLADGTFSEGLLLEDMHILVAWLLSALAQSYIIVRSVKNENELTHDEQEADFSSNLRIEKALGTLPMDATCLPNDEEFAEMVAQGRIPHLQAASLVKKTLAKA